MVSTEHAQLLVERTELLRELSSQQLALSQTVDDISRLEADIVAMETANQKRRGELQEISNKSTLLSAHSLNCQEKANVVRELSKRTLGREELFRCVHECVCACAQFLGVALFNHSADCCSSTK